MKFSKFIHVCVHFYDYLGKGCRGKLCFLSDFVTTSYNYDLCLIIKSLLTTFKL